MDLVWVVSGSDIINKDGKVEKVEKVEKAVKN